jgi:hypothetical protein
MMMKSAEDRLISEPAEPLARTLHPAFCPLPNSCMEVQLCLPRTKSDRTKSDSIDDEVRREWAE